MKRTIPTLAVLMAATLFTAVAAHAQSAAKAWPPGPTGEATAYPPGPSVQAYPPGPSVQAGAAAQTNNVNVVNVPTVTVGNEVTVKESEKEPALFGRDLDMAPSFTYNQHQFIVPAGKRLVIENVNVKCSSTVAQPFGFSLLRPGSSYYDLYVIPQLTTWGTGSAAAHNYPVHLLVDDSIQITAFRGAGTGLALCFMSLTGYLTPLL